MTAPVDGELLPDDHPGPNASLPGSGPSATHPVSGREVARSVAHRVARRANDPGPDTFNLAPAPAYVDDYDPDDAVPLEVDQALYDSIPKNTRETVEYQWGRFVRWCGAMEREHLPATVATIRFYIHAHMTMTRADGRLRGRRGRPYAPATVSTALGCICSVHEWNGYPSPWKHPAVRRQLKKYREDWYKAGHRPDEAYAVTLDENHAMVRSRDLTTAAGLRDAVMIALQFAIGARASEICDLNIEDLTFPAHGRMMVHIRWSKGGEPRDVAVEADTVGYAPDCDPTLLIREWLDLLTTRGYTRGPLFRQVMSGKRRLVGHSGKIVDKRVDRHAYEQIHRRAAQAAGVDVDPQTGRKRILVTHSQRAGYITTMADAGVPLERVRLVTGHSANSPVIFRYYRSALKWGDHNPLTRTRKVLLHRRQEENRETR